MVEFIFGLVIGMCCMYQLYWWQKKLTNDMTEWKDREIEYGDKWKEMFFELMKKIKQDN